MSKQSGKSAPVTTDNHDAKPDKADLPDAADSTTNQTGTAATATPALVDCANCEGIGTYTDGTVCDHCNGTGKVPTAAKAAKAVSNPDDVDINEDPDDMTDSDVKGDGTVNPDEVDTDDTINPDEVDPNEDPLKGKKKKPKKGSDGEDECDDDDEPEEESAAEDEDDDPEGGGKKAPSASTKIARRPAARASREVPEVGHRIYKAAVELELDESTDRTVKYIASDETPDRYGDIIRAQGWQLENFVRNPVFLFAHDSSSPPIGRVTDITVKGKRLLSKVTFMPEGMNSFCDMLWKMVKSGFLRAVSVGFYPTVPPEAMLDAKGHFLGYEFIGQELVELSLVPVPANPNALQLAKSFGASDKDLTKMFREYHAAKQRDVSRVLGLHSREIEIVKARRRGS